MTEDSESNFGNGIKITCWQDMEVKKEKNKGNALIYDLTY